MNKQSTKKGRLWANHDWQENIRKSDGQKFWSVLVGPTDLNVTREDDVAYKWVVNESDTITVNGVKVPLKGYCDFLVKKATGNTNPKGVLVVHCDEVVVGEKTTLTFKDGSENPQVNLYPTNGYELAVVRRNRPSEVTVNEAEKAELEAFLAKTTRAAIVDVKDGEEPF